MKKSILVLMLLLMLPLSAYAGDCYMPFPLTFKESIKPVGTPGIWKDSKLVENLPVFCAFCSGIKEFYMPIYAMPIKGECKKSIAKHSKIEEIKILHLKNHKHCFFSRSEAKSYFNALPCVKRKK